LQLEVKKKARTARRQRRQVFLKGFLARLIKNQASYVKRCVRGFKRQQTLRMLRKKPAITPAQLGRCLACIKKANCSTTKQRGCRAVCMR
jgi:hypothetical protein